MKDVYTFEELYDYTNSLPEPKTRHAANNMLVNFLFNLGHCCGEGPYMKALQFPPVLMKALAILNNRESE